MSHSKPIPSFSVNRVVVLRRRIVDEAFLGETGMVFSGQDFHDLVDRVAAVLPAGIARAVLVDTMRSIIGTPVTAATEEDLAWRLAGNVRRLKAGHAVPPWTHQPFPEWAPVRVEAVYPAVRKGGRKDAARPGTPPRHGANVRFRFLSGLPAGRVVTRFWSQAFINRYRTVFGFDRYDNQRGQIYVTPGEVALPLHDVREIGRFRMVVWVAQAFCRDGPGFDDGDVRCPAGMRNWNRDIQKKRRRFGWACPRGWSTPCHKCPVGWDECPAACHPVEFTWRFCSGCNREWWYDPEAGAALCVDCSRHSD